MLYGLAGYMIYMQTILPMMKDRAIEATDLLLTRERGTERLTVNKSIPIPVAG